ncbi:endoribonuclease ysh1 [Dimargaris cristalligena]|nr:endoribonuclease ysh1 [Dimargaris cristalligena]
MAYKRKPYEHPIRGQSDVLRITPLGAGNEVGRSCIVIEFKGKKIMLDAGVHPAFTGIGALPFFDMIDPAEIDLLLVSHFHLDHAAAVPYFMEKTTFQGRTFMTHPTKAIYRWLLGDYVRVSSASGENQLYEEENMRKSFERIEAIDYHEVVEVDGIRFTAFNAGHVLGAAMFLIEIADIKILYTGDYSREEDRHLMAAENPNVPIDLLICESTYGVQSHEPRVEREARFTALTHQVVQRGGRCLIPVFALGRAQELLLILEEYWESHDDLKSIPIYYASSLAKKCMAIYQTYINMMNDHIRRQFAISNPFIFKHISYLRGLQRFDDTGPCVMMASPGMLQNGLSRQLFERWCPDKRNGVIITGYSVEGTLARRILNEPDEIESVNGGTLPMRMSIGSISFSAHVDYTQNSEFIYEVNAPHVLLVHGETNNMGRLRAALQDHFTENDMNTKIYTPQNCETVEIYFKAEKVSRMVGGLAQQTVDFLRHQEQLLLTATDSDDADPEADGPAAAKRAKNTENSDADQPPATLHVDGILVVKDYEYRIVDEAHLNEFTGLSTSEILQRQVVSYNATHSLLKYHLEQMFGVVEKISVQMNPPNRIEGTHQFDPSAQFHQFEASCNVKAKAETETETEFGTPSGPSPSADTSSLVLRVYNTVDVVHKPELGVVELEWIGNYVNDMVADSILAIILNVESSPASVKMTKSECGHSHGSSSPKAPSPTTKPSHNHQYASRFTPDQINTVVEALKNQFGPIVTLDQSATLRMAECLEQKEEGQVVEAPGPQEAAQETTASQSAIAEKDTTVTDAPLSETADEADKRMDEDTSVDDQPPTPTIGDETVVSLQVKIDDDLAIISLKDLQVTATSDSIRERVNTVLSRAKQTLRPTPDPSTVSA